MSANQFTVKTIRDSAVDQIARKLECAVNFLSKYNSLRSENLSVLDERYSDLEKFQSCYLFTVEAADCMASSYRFSFLGSEYADEFKAIYSCVNDLRFKTSVFQNIDQLKTIIDFLASNIRSGTLVMPASDIKEVA